MTLEVVGIIPARGGSKGIPRKNIALLAGRPLIAWTIEAARLSRGLSRVIVSTEDKEIADIARQQGAEVPFLRPAEFAQDNTSGKVPIRHAVTWLDENERYLPDLVMCLQPTSPLRSADDIDAAIEVAARKKADAVVSVNVADRPPDWMRYVEPDGRLKEFCVDGPRFERRQDAPPIYALNGAIYLLRRSLAVEDTSWYTDSTYAYIMPPERSLDIDTPWDMSLADLILKDKIRHEIT